MNFKKLFITTLIVLVFSISNSKELYSFDEVPIQSSITDLNIQINENNKELFNSIGVTSENIEEILLKVNENEESKKAFLNIMLEKAKENRDKEENEKKQLIKLEEERLKDEKEEEHKQMIKNKGKGIIIGEHIYNERIINGFANARCTWYAASQTFPFEEGSVTHQQKLWSGNARDWYRNAQRNGFQVGDEPLVGSIITFRGYGYSNLGHVGIVREVGKDTVTIEDMRVKKQRYAVTKRVILKSDKAISGYIYL